MAMTGTKIERAFASKMKSEGWEVYKNGFPDFLCIKDNKGILVEVKAKNKEKLQKHQFTMMSLLVNRRLRIFVWSPAMSKPIPFRKFQYMIPKKKQKPTQKINQREKITAPHLTTVSEAADLLGLTRQALYKRIKMNTLKKVIIGKHIFVNRKELS